MQGSRQSFIWLCLLALVIGAVLVALFGCVRGRQTEFVATVIGTNVTSVSAQITRAPGHVFYYPSRLRYEWDNLRERVGLGGKRISQKLAASPSPPADVLWVALKFREKLPVLRLIVAEECDDSGQVRYYKALGGLLDGDRRESVCKWCLTGGAQMHRGKTIHIRTMIDGKELAAIDFR